MERIKDIDIEEVQIELTDEEIREIENAYELPITFDEDCPDTTPERAVKFERVNPKNIAIG